MSSVKLDGIQNDFMQWFPMHRNLMAFVVVLVLDILTLFHHWMEVKEAHSTTAASFLNRSRLI
jgi:hypothetical protein